MDRTFSLPNSCDGCPPALKHCVISFQGRCASSTETMLLPKRGAMPQSSHSTAAQRHSRSAKWRCRQYLVRARAGAFFIFCVFVCIYLRYFRVFLFSGVCWFSIVHGLPNSHVRLSAHGCTQVHTPVVSMCSCTHACMHANVYEHVMYTIHFRRYVPASYM